MITLKDFPISSDEKGIILNKDKKVIFDFKNSSPQEYEEFLKILCVCANYGKRALLQKKMKSFDSSLEEAIEVVILEMMIKNYNICLQNEVEFEYTVVSFDSKHILKPKEKKVLYFKQINN